MLYVICVCVCVYVYVSHMCMCMWECCTCHVCVCVYVYVSHMCMCMCKCCMCHICVCVTYVYVYVYMCMCHICVCVCVSAVCLMCQFARPSIDRKNLMIQLQNSNLNLIPCIWASAFGRHLPISIPILLRVKPLLQLLNMQRWRAAQKNKQIAWDVYHTETHHFHNKLSSHVFQRCVFCLVMHGSGQSHLHRHFKCKQSSCGYDWGKQGGFRAAGVVTKY